LSLFSKIAVYICMTVTGRACCSNCHLIF